MRQAGKIHDEQLARRFVDYLLTLGIAARAEPDGNAWAVWIIEEKNLAAGKQELKRFLAAPRDAGYREAEKQAARLRRAEAKKEEQYAANVVDVRSRWQKGTAGRIPVTLTFLAISIAVTLVTGLGKNLEPYGNWVFIASRTVEGNIVRWPGLQEITHGQIWRLVTPIFIHLGWIHLAFNMYMFFQFGMIVEVRRGWWRLLVMILVVAVLSNLAQYWWPYLKAFGEKPPWPGFGGMSGVLYGLFGYCWMKTKFEPALTIILTPSTVFILVGWLFVCMAGVIPHVANAAHVAGLLVGIAIGFAPVAWRNIRRR